MQTSHNWLLAIVRGIYKDSVDDFGRSKQLELLRPVLAI
jgi:hypothetical protein